MNKRFPPRLDDPGKFSVPCMIGPYKFSKALSNHGADVMDSINYKHTKVTCIWGCWSLDLILCNC